MGSFSGYYLCNGDQLYASGSNYEGRLGTAKRRGNEPMPVYVQDKVTKIFSGNQASNFFFITSQPDLLYGCGRNYYGELGIGITNDGFPKANTVVKNFQGSEILTVSPGDSHTILITKKGQTYSCGHQAFNGHGKFKHIFTLVPPLKEKKAVQLSTGKNRTLVLTDQNELYIWGIPEHLFPTDE
ncbi:guanidine nucleotide exchange factor [Anaeramoeba flamelloides]|uniref:Guanidine nucleotide exchange factor n=1 Tax=Anaeramoeba flamelloides TaxID=1746091 RepID=A0ABQ8XLZ3_9EUKA|nr:guanidine nucleotide exchange factor [Anaeramoeba flamelloides]